MRRSGKTQTMNLACAFALNIGRHVHVWKLTGQECLGGDPNCKLWNEQLEKLLKS